MTDPSTAPPTAVPAVCVEGHGDRPCPGPYDCPEVPIDTWCANPPPWSEDDVRAAFEALGDETNQDDLIHHLRHNPAVAS